ncbi:MAG TPA: response regulator [Aquimonas sp.]|jgi:twitching motility two-component system response regulator PilH|nr:response regulator [Xanthomonadales bacterium]HRD72087.1 response regulator [Aquimonas sp.]HRF54300.1 response regulator [Aquimonas sp.]
MARILIIEDSPTDAHVMARLLERHGHQVVHADSAETGVERARTDLPDLVLMDVILPGMNGFQATRQLSKDPKTQHIPVIIVSTKGMETDRVWGMRQGAKDYVVKPPAEADLLARINALIRGN